MSQIENQNLKEEFYKLINYYSNIDTTFIPKELNTESEVLYYNLVIKKNRRPSQFSKKILPFYSI